MLDLRVGWQVSTSNIACLTDYIAAGGIAGRQVADKTYYMGLLNTQLGLLQKEIDSLSDELTRAEREQQNLLLYEQKAEEKANEIKELQNELSDYNLVKLNLETRSTSPFEIIDRQNTSANDIRDLEFEVSEEQKRTAELSSTVEELFKERREAEDQCHQLEEKLEEVKRQNANFLSNLVGLCRRSYSTCL